MSTEPFRQLVGVAAPLMRPNIDTDAIIPSREMKRVSKKGLGEGLFAEERYLDVAARTPNPDFVLNRTEYRDCSILLADANFGCGSSREHAVWALREYGIRAIIAPSFGSIFANNCVRNGLLPLRLDKRLVRKLSDWVQREPARHRLHIDLEMQRVRAGEMDVPFAIDSGARHMLLNGLDAIALTQTRWEQIEAFHNARRLARPWLYRDISES